MAMRTDPIMATWLRCHTTVLNMDQTHHATIDYPGLVSALIADQTRGTCLKSRADARVVRTALDDDRSMIVKLWSRPGWRGVIRRMTGTSSLQRENRTLLRLHKAGVAVPRPLAYLRLGRQDAPYTDALCLEDLGESVLAMSHLKKLIRLSDTAAAEQIEQEMIDMTGQMVDDHVLDPDHGLHNMIVTNAGRLVRLDFETAQHVISVKFQPKLYSEMLGRLITTYVFAVQPDLKRIEPFIRKLIRRCRPPQEVLAAAQVYYDRAMQKQWDQQNVDSRLRWVDNVSMN